MSLEHLKSIYARRPSQEQAEFLAQLAHELTLCGRDAYPRVSEGATDEERIRSLQGINELQRVVATQLSKLLGGHSAGYPDEALCEALGETAAIYGLERELERAVEHSADERSIAQAQP